MNHAQKSRRGRKPAQESRSAEIRQRVAAWKAIPCEQRPPITRLARDLGISHQLASYYASVVPSPNPVAEFAAALRAKLPQIVNIVKRWDEIKSKMKERRPLSRYDLRFLRKAAVAGNRKARALLNELEDGSGKVGLSEPEPTHSSG